MATERLVIQIDEKGALVAKRNIEGVGQSAKATGGALQLLKRALAALAAADLVRRLIGIADAFTNIQNRLRIVTEGTQELAFVTDELFNISKRTRSDFEATAIVYQKVALASGELGLTTKDTLKFVESLNQAVVLSGADAQTAKAGLRQLAQGIGAGALRGDELISVLENLPEVANIIARELGVGIGKLRELGKEGKISSDIIIQAFQNQRKEIEGNYQKTVITIGQAFTLLQNNIVRFVGELTTSTGASRSFAAAVQFVANNLETFARAGAAVLTGFLVNYSRTAIPAAINATKALGAAIASNPVGLLVTAFAALAAAVIFFSDKLRVGGGELATFADVGAAALERVQNGLDALRQGVQNAVDFYASAFSGVTDANLGVVTSLRTVLGAVTLTLDQIVGAVTGVIGVIVFEFKGLPNLIGNAFARAFNFLSEQAKDFVNGVIRLINRARVAVGNDPLGFVLKAPRIDVPELDRGGQRAADVFFAAFKNTPLTDLLEGILDDAELKAFERKLREVRSSADTTGDGGGGTAGGGEAQTELSLVEKTVRQLQQEAELLQLNNRERERRAAILQVENQLMDKEKELSEADRKRIDTLLRENQELSLQAELLERIRGPQDEYVRAKEKLNQLLADDIITQEEYRRGLESISKDTQELGRDQQVFVDIFGAAWDNALGAVRDFVSGGKVQFREFASSVLSSISDILAGLLRIQAQNALGSALGIPGFGGGLPGNATGASFMVGGAGGTDSQVVAFRASPNERVDVLTPAQQQAQQQAMAPAPQAASSQPVKIVNVIDREEMRAAMSEDDGTRVIINTMRRNKNTVRQVLG